MYSEFKKWIKLVNLEKYKLLTSLRNFKERILIKLRNKK